MRAIDGGKFSDAKLLKAEYENLKQELGRIPNLLDFDANGAIDPLLFISKYGSYYAFVNKYDRDYKHELAQTQVEVLKTVSQKLANGKRMEDLLLLRGLIEKGSVAIPAFKAAASRVSGRAVGGMVVESAYRVLSGYFSSVEKLSLIDRSGDSFVASGLLQAALRDSEFKRLLLETIEFGLRRREMGYSRCYRDTNLVLYAKYTYEEVCRLLNWDKNVNGQNIGFILCHNIQHL